ncbi:MAG: hypothetical protein PHN78_06485 [Dehalococcoidales bacterium]|nr:hypothetical protein [Dehalococcoidales bacterium]
MPDNNEQNRLLRVITRLLAVAGVLLSAFCVTSVAPRVGIVVGAIQYITLGAAMLLSLSFLVAVLFLADGGIGRINRYLRIRRDVMAG